MIFFKKLHFIFILIFFLISCSGKQVKSDESLYDFPPLSKEQLIVLKEKSKTMEGFFMTTDLSDLDNSWAERGFYLYVCIRFLNDSTVNNLLNKSAIPLLIQASNYKNKPEAESLLLLHPKVKNIFYYKERKHFQLTDSAILIRDRTYNIFDVTFNSSGRITHVSFLKEGASMEELEQVLSQERENEEDGNKAKNTKDVILEVRGFAKQYSSSCSGWPILNYDHSNEPPDYL